MFGTYRALLAFMVVALHLGGVPIIGPYAVFGFYILSGYLMTTIMHTRYGYSPVGFLQYAVNRALRIYPAYWVSLIDSPRRRNL
ncbi:MAG: peptidoglycan/LPS O-acetylase OafA/YrhL [Candidatus Promineifilaceae bacterium]|jgi:peptidoglycan/LPS O-acetylase OafA/YrhL